MRTLTLAVLLFIIPSVIAHGPSTSEVQGWINGPFASALSSGDVSQVQALIASDARVGLSAEVQSKASEPIDFRYRVSSISSVSDHTIRVNGDFEADTINWRVSGMSAYFLLEESGEGWLVQDTNLFSKFGVGYVFKVMGVIFSVVGLVMFILGIFWLWMLIDCVRRDFDGKVVWLVVLLLLNFLGAVIYFFAVKLRGKGSRRSNRKR